MSDYFLGSYLAKRLGLNERYFNIAFARKQNLKAEIIKIQGRIFVKPCDEIAQAMKNGYIAFKMAQSVDVKNCDFCIELSKKCVLGFYK